MASSGVDVLADSVHATTAHPAAAETARASISRLRQHSRVPALDGIRGFAAAWVFFYHYLPGTNSTSQVVHRISLVNRMGWSAVSLFFVLSGFLISGILWDSFGSEAWWRSFFVRRALRIFPLYYLALGICVAIFVLGPVHTIPIRHLWVHVFYLQDVPPLQGWGGALPPSIFLLHFWSLAVEEQFYLLWPFVLAALFRQRRLALNVIAGCWVLSLAFRVTNYWYAAHHAGASTLWSSASLPGRSGELLAGAFLALLIRERPALLDRLYRCLPWVLTVSFVGSAGVLALARTPGPEDPVTGVIGLSLLSVFFASLIATSLQPGLVQSIFQARLLRWFGTISYGIYVYHMLFLPQFEAIRDRLVPDAGQKELRAIVLMLIAMAATLIIAPLSYRFIESPILRLKKTFSPGRNMAIPS